jgi:hypothetical protein
MNLSAVAQKALGASELYFKKHGPTILTGAGVVGFVATTVLVARASVKAKPIVDDLAHGLNAIENMDLDESYTRKQQVNDYGRGLVDGTKDLAKIYGPAIIVGGLSITCIISAHGMLKKQNTALVAAYGVLDAGFRAYRARVAEEVGEDKERDIYRGVIARRKEEAEDGTVCIIEDYSRKSPNIFSKYFDESNVNFSRTPDFNHAFLKGQQDYANNRLQAKGYLFLNDVYDSLGFQRTQPGQVVGWLAKTDEGDGYIDFGIYDIANEASRAFVNGIEEVVLLDFNVDGVILNKFE